MVSEVSAGLKYQYHTSWSTVLVVLSAITEVNILLLCSLIIPTFLLFTYFIFLFFPSPFSLSPSLSFPSFLLFLASFLFSLSRCIRSSMCELFSYAGKCSSGFFFYRGSFRISFRVPHPLFIHFLSRLPH